MRCVRLVLFLCAALVAGQSPVEQLQVQAPYVTTPAKVVSAMLRLAGVRKGDLVYDLGCGDGRIVIAAARQYGARGVGVDPNPERIQESRGNARKAGVERLVKFELSDVFDTDLHDATVVALYLLADINLRLRPKLLHELRPGARVISNTFGMGDWKPDQEQIVEGSHIYLWTIPAAGRVSR